MDGTGWKMIHPHLRDVFLFSNRPKPKRKGHLFSNHTFSGANMLASGMYIEIVLPSNTLQESVSHIQDMRKSSTQKYLLVWDMLVLLKTFCINSCDLGIGKPKSNHIQIYNKQMETK